MAKQEFFGLDIYRKGDEGYVNAFDIANNNRLDERAKRLLEKSDPLLKIFNDTMK